MSSSVFIEVSWAKDGKIAKFLLILVAIFIDNWQIKSQKMDGKLLVLVIFVNLFLVISANSRCELNFVFQKIQAYQRFFSHRLCKPENMRHVPWPRQLMRLVFRSGKRKKIQSKLTNSSTFTCHHRDKKESQEDYRECVCEITRMFTNIEVVGAKSKNLPAASERKKKNQAPCVFTIFLILNF